MPTPISTNHCSLLPRPTSLATSHFSNAVNSTKHGIGRIETLQEQLVVNNIGRNVQFISASHSGASEAATVFAETAFPGEDLASLLDLDMHAFLRLEGLPYTLASNHFGTIRAFHLDKTSPQTGNALSAAIPDFELQWVGDTERLVILQDWLISTSCRGHETNDHAQPGLLVSQRLSPIIARAQESFSRESLLLRHQIGYETFLADWGFTTGVAANDSGDRIAVNASRRLALFDPCASNTGFPLLQWPLWEIELPFSGMWMRFNSDGSRLYVAGSDVAVDTDNFDDWNAVGGGGLICLDCSAGEILFKTRFEVPIAWGYGSVPIVLHKSGQAIYALDRLAGLHRLETRDGTTGQIYNSPLGIDSSLGLAHATQTPNQIVAGYNRGGYRLFVYQLAH